MSSARGAAAGRWFLVALLGSAGVLHFAQPRFFLGMIPRELPGSREAWNVAAGVAELSAASLLAVPRTRRLGGALAFATLAFVWPGNWKAAIEGGYRGVPEPWGGAVAAWVRVPLQLPLLWLAWRQARAERPATD